MAIYDILGDRTIYNQDALNRICDISNLVLSTCPMHCQSFAIIGGLIETND